MKRSIFTNVMSVIIIMIINTSIFAQETLKSLLPIKIDYPIVIDGVLDDQVWKEAPWETGFKTWYPDYGIEMDENTKVWYAYDSENLYFAFRCYDSQPDKIKTSVTARDKISPDDWICINLDTFNDQQSLYAFYTNPLGIQMDSRTVGNKEDISIDFVWYSEGRIDEHGYTVEIKIPFKSIRFSSKDPVEMGVIFERHISRKSEKGTYPPLDPKHGPNFMTQTRTLIYDDVKYHRLLEVLPAVTYSKNSSINQGKLVSEGDDSELSLTAKFGISSHLVLGGTVNPDFSQVEADAGQVDFNQRYALYYPEKRSFFFEGSEYFNLGGGRTCGDPLRKIVHTRKIVDPVMGAKLTGKVGDKNTIALIYALDELPQYQQKGDYANFAILRYKRALKKDSFIGGFYTGRELEDSYNRVLGADGQIRVNNSSIIGYHAFMSLSKDTIEYNGYALGVNYYYNTRTMLMNIRLHDLSEDFNTETGFVRRTGITSFKAGLTRMLYPDSKIIRRIDPSFNNQFIWDKQNDRWENNNSFSLTFVLPRSSRISMGYTYSNEVFLDEKFNTGSFNIFGRSQFTKQFYFNLSYRSSKKIRYVSGPYQGKGSNASASVIYQPSTKLYSSLSLTYSDFYRDIDDKKEFDYTIIRSRNTYQMNKYLFFRAIIEYNSFHKELMTDFLASFTYIPGTVLHIGYGSRYDKTEWKNDRYKESARFLETQRGFFLKASYLWRI